MSESVPSSQGQDPSLTRLLSLWPDLPEPVRASLIALAEAAQSATKRGGK